MGSIGVASSRRAPTRYADVPMSTTVGGLQTCRQQSNAVDRAIDQALLNSLM